MMGIKLSGYVILNLHSMNITKFHGTLNTYIFSRYSRKGYSYNWFRFKNKLVDLVLCDW